MNGYRISSVGELYFKNGPQRQALGADPKSFFETMVFQTVARAASGNDGCGCRAVTGWSEIDSARYATAGEAQRGHERMVAKYARKPKKKGGKP